MVCDSADFFVSLLISLLQLRRASGICVNNYEFCEGERLLQLVGGLHVVDVSVFSATLSCYLGSVLV